MRNTHRWRGTRKGGFMTKRNAVMWLPAAALALVLTGCINPIADRGGTTVTNDAGTTVTDDAGSPKVTDDGSSPKVTDDGGSPKVTDDGDPKVTDDGVPPGTVYTAGYYYDEGGSKACYWQNGTRVDLDGRAASAIAVSGSDVYVAGTYLDGNPQACYWKNGTRVDLDGHEARAIAVSGSDVYVAGSYLGTVYGVGMYNSQTIVTDKACYWKNGVRVDLPNPGVGGTQAWDIAVLGE